MIEHFSKAAFVVAYGVTGLSGSLMGILLGYLIWGR